MSDLEKRVNELEIRVLDERLFRAFDTRPGSRKLAEREEKRGREDRDDPVALPFR
jgi:hypothetical protein